MKEQQNEKRYMFPLKTFQEKIGGGGGWRWRTEKKRKGPLVVPAR